MMAGEMWGLEKTVIGRAIKNGSVSDLKQAIANGEDVTFTDKKGNTYLHYVCTMYRPYIFNILAVSDIDINSRNKHGNTALHVTTLHRECGHVADLLMYGIDPFVTNKDGKIASDIKGRGPYWQTIYDKYLPGIFQAVDEHNVERVKELLHCWCRTDSRREGQTLRQYAAARKHHDIVLILDQHRHTLEAIFGVLEVNHAKVSKAINSGKCDINFLNMASELKHILLHALRLKDKAMVRLLCAGGVDINLPIRLQNYLTTPLYFAALHPRLPTDVIWSVLKSSKPNFLLKDQRGRNAVIFALDKTNREIPLEIIQYMLQNGIYLADRDETGLTARDVARLARRRDVVDVLDKMYVKLLREEDMEKLERLAQDGYDSMLITSHYRDTYIYACGNETDTVVRFVQHLPDFQTRCQRLREATRKESVGTLATLLDDYPKPYLLANCKDKGGRGLLHWAVLHWRTDVIRFLLSLHYVDCNIQDNLLRTPLHYACAMQEEERENFKDQLIQAGCHAQTLDCQWLTAEDYEKYPDKTLHLGREKSLIYGMDKQLLCVDKYEELRRIINNKRRTLKDFKMALRGFKQRVSSFAKLLSPVMDDYRDLIFVAVDRRQLEMAEYLAHLGTDLTRKEQYLVLRRKEILQEKAPNSRRTSTTLVRLQPLPSDLTSDDDDTKAKEQLQECGAFPVLEPRPPSEEGERLQGVESSAGHPAPSLADCSLQSLFHSHKKSLADRPSQQNSLTKSTTETGGLSQAQDAKSQSLAEAKTPLPEVELLTVIERAQRLGYENLVAVFERKLEHQKQQRQREKAEKKNTTKEASPIGCSSSDFSERSLTGPPSLSCDNDVFSSDDEDSYSSDTVTSSESVSVSSAFDAEEDL